MAAWLTPTTVSSAELVRQFGRWQDEAASQPVLVTHHGRGRVVLVSAAHYDELVSSRPSASARGSEPVGDGVAELMEHVDQGFVAFDRNMTVVEINRAACCFMKTEREAVLGRTLNERLPGIEETFGYASLTRASQAGAITTIEMPSFTFEGRWLLFQTFPFRDGAACLFRDITDELETRRRAHAKTATLAAMAVHGGVGRAKLTVRGTFNELDAGFAALTGFAPEGLARARLTDIVAPHGRAAAARAIERVLEGGEPERIDTALLTRSGAERMVRIGLAGLRNHDGPAGAVAVASERVEG